jgi:hypothetical protein
MTRDRKTRPMNAVNWTIEGGASTFISRPIPKNEGAQASKQADFGSRTIPAKKAPLPAS